MKQIRQPKNVRLGSVDTEEQIASFSAALAIAYEKARWRWSDPFQRARTRGHFPTAKEIADHIRGTAAQLATWDTPWCYSGGIFLFKENGSMCLGVAPKLAAHNVAEALEEVRRHG